MKIILLAFVCLLCSLGARPQSTFDYYVSNSGSDTSAGNSSLHPKKTVAGVASAVSAGSLSGKPLRIGFKRGDVFKETFFPGFPVMAGSYLTGLNNKPFAIFDGADSFDSGWVKNDSAFNVYEQSVPLQGYTGYGIGVFGQYSFISVFEIDKEQERTAPLLQGGCSGFATLVKQLI